MDLNIVEVSPETVADHPWSICFINKKQETFPQKAAWLAEQYKAGLKINLIYLEGEKKPVGFVEYVPGEHAWRGVDAKGFMFIHCIWTYRKKHQHQGLGARLIELVEAKSGGTKGVAVMTSDGPFMAGKDLFLRNGFELADVSGKNQLLVKLNRKGPMPKFCCNETLLQQYTGMHILFSKQCPWVARFIHELDKDLIESWKIQIKEVKTPEEAQQLPSPYSVFTLINNGKILADRYISKTRFNNILKKQEAEE